MLSKWIDLYRGYDEQRYTELCALLIRYDIKRRTQVARPDSKVAAMYGASGAYPGTPDNTRQGYINQSSFWAQEELERTEKADKLYIIRVRTKDHARVQALIKELDRA